MSTVSYESHGRVAQKQRTRTALVNAARALLARGETPTVEATADEAAISRTTAYRYFPNQAALLGAAYPEMDKRSLLPADPPEDAGERLAIVMAAHMQLLLTNEIQLRATLRLSLEPAGAPRRDLPMRQGRVITWLTDALEPARDQLGDAGLRRLVLSIRSATGIESFVWLVDVGGRSRQQAVEQLTWTGAALYRAAVAEAT